MTEKTLAERHQELRDEIVAHLSRPYRLLPDSPDKARALHMVRVYVASIPHKDLAIRWVEIVGRNGK